MNTKPKNKMFVLNTELQGKPAGSRVRLEVNNKGIVKDKYWRERVNDAKIDNCIKEVKPDSKIKKVNSDAE